MDFYDFVNYHADVSMHFVQHVYTQLSYSTQTVKPKLLEFSYIIHFPSFHLTKAIFWTSIFLIVQDIDINQYIYYDKFCALPLLSSFFFLFLLSYSSSFNHAIMYFYMWPQCCTHMISYHMKQLILHSATEKDNDLTNGRQS